MKAPRPFDPVLAKIDYQGDLGQEQWNEVVFYDGESWRSYADSETFQDGENVSKWVYCNDAFNE